MSTDIVRHFTPEEEELAIKREDLARLEIELTDRELALANLKAELAAFEGLYLRKVGVLYAELDEWNARLAELQAEHLGSSEARAAATDARAKAEESHAAAHSAASDAQPFTPSPELKRLYREAAKRVHPDTATDEADRERRERLMKDVNAAYAAGDEDALRRNLAELETSPDTVQGSGVGADLVRVLRQLRQVRNRISAIGMEYDALLQTHIAVLRLKVDEATAEGRDLIAEMVSLTQLRIDKAKRDFQSKMAARKR